MFGNRGLNRLSRFGKSLVMPLYLVLNILVASLSGASVGRPQRHLFDDQEIHTEYVDRNNQTILDGFNLTEAQKSRIAVGIQHSDFIPPPRDSNYFKNIKDLRLNSIRQTLGAVVGRAEPSLHEMAAYPTCNGETNESSWQHEYNVTIQFSNSFLDIKRENYNLESALLRLYKINPNATNNEQSQKESEQTQRIPVNRCADPFLDSQIRVTVSIVQQFRRNKRSERKKRICNTMMMNVSKTGWVEIDIKRAIHIWNDVQKQQQNSQQPQRSPILVGYLMIEVHDEEERPLKPGLFFKPPNCEEAALAVPWTYYGSQSPLSAFKIPEVPSYPRIDMKLLGFATFTPKNDPQEPDEDDSSNESITSNSPKNENILENSTAADSVLPANLKSIMHSKMIRKRHQQLKQQQEEQHHHQYNPHRQYDHQRETNDDKSYEKFYENSEERSHHQYHHHRRQRHYHHHNGHNTYNHHNHQHHKDLESQEQNQDEIEGLHNERQIEDSHLEHRPKKLHHRLIQERVESQSI